MGVKATFGARLRELRGMMKQDEFGDKIGVSRTSISYYEKEKRTADIEILDRLCREYNVSADWLLGLSKNSSSDEDMQAACRVTGLSEKSIIALARYSKNENPYDAICLRILDRLASDGALNNMVSYFHRYMKPATIERGEGITWRYEEDRDFCAWRVSRDVLEWFVAICDRYGMELRDDYRMEAHMIRENMSEETKEFAALDEQFAAIRARYNDLIDKYANSGPLVDIPDNVEDGQDGKYTKD